MNLVFAILLTAIGLLWLVLLLPDTPTEAMGRRGAALDAIPVAAIAVGALWAINLLVRKFRRSAKPEQQEREGQDRAA